METMKNSVADMVVTGAKDFSDLAVQFKEEMKKFDDYEKPAAGMLLELVEGIAAMTESEWEMMFNLPIYSWIDRHSDEELDAAAPILVCYLRDFVDAIRERVMDKNIGSIE